MFPQYVSDVTQFALHAALVVLVSVVVYKVGLRVIHRIFAEPGEDR